MPIPCLPWSSALSVSLPYLLHLVHMTITSFIKKPRRLRVAPVFPLHLDVRALRGGRPPRQGRPLLGSLLTSGPRKSHITANPQQSFHCLFLLLIAVPVRCHVTCQVVAARCIPQSVSQPGIRLRRLGGTFRVFQHFSMTEPEMILCVPCRSPFLSPPVCFLPSFTIASSTLNFDQPFRQLWPCPSHMTSARLSNQKHHTNKDDGDSSLPRNLQLEQTTVCKKIGQPKSPLSAP